VDTRRWRTDTGLYDTPYLFAAVFQFPILVVPFLPGASQEDLKKILPGYYVI
jgi:hypothetical protein